MKKKPKTPSLKHQVITALTAMKAYGQSKLDAKIENAGKVPAGKIFSHSTFKAYLGVSLRFAEWVKDAHGCRTLEEARAYMSEYLNKRINEGKSAWTLRLDAAALAKLYGIKSTELGVILPRRNLADVKQHRGSKAASQFSESKNQDLVDFCRSCGLRRHEVEQVRPYDVWQDSDGVTIVHVRQGKGGRSRFVPALNDFPLRMAEKAMQNSWKFLFKEIPVRAPIHAYRSEYACSLYHKFARPVVQLARAERYVCRGILSGVVYDRAAMLRVSEALGHSRVNVMTHYLYDRV